MGGENESKSYYEDAFYCLVFSIKRKNNAFLPTALIRLRKKSHHLVIIVNILPRPQRMSHGDEKIGVMAAKNVMKPTLTEHILLAMLL